MHSLASRIQKHLIAASASAPLYHLLNAKKARTAFIANRLTALFAHKRYKNLGKGISLTRNKLYRHYWAGASIRFTFDQAKLRQRYRIIPLDAEHAVGHSYSDRMKPLTPYETYYDVMAEEYLIGSIKPLHRYLTKVEVYYHNSESELIVTMIKYCKKHSIPYEIYYKDGAAGYDEELDQFDRYGNLLKYAGYRKRK